jgi:hypothetical protein
MGYWAFTQLHFQVLHCFVQTTIKLLSISHKRVVLFPVTRDIDTPAYPDPVMTGDVVKESLQTNHSPWATK